MFTTLDYAILIIYLIGVAAFGIWAGGRQTSTTEYFLGGRDLPWWAVCLSVVATETSTLTVIGVPAVSYFGALTFLQMSFGYLLGRIIVSIYFLPKYYAGKLNTAYAFLGQRFGDGMRGSASVVFLGTRLLADGVRLFATAVPLKVIFDTVGLPMSYFEIIVIIGLVTAVYTLIGGIKAVVWMDVVQMTLYVAGALFAIVLLLNQVPAGWFAEATAEGKTQIFQFGLADATFSEWITEPYMFVTAIVGGAVFSMASHGTDQLIVQRLLACRNTLDSKKALIGSGVLVIGQFALFLSVGLLLWAYYGGASPEALGLARGDEIFPMYIINEMPAGISGLLLAGIIAAAMSSLSSSLNALASSSVNDLYERIIDRKLGQEEGVRVSRLMTLVWGVVFIGFASLFQDQQNPVVELGLSIAAFTYGGLLGAFLLGLLNERAKQLDAIISFFLTIAIMVFIASSIWYDPGTGWLIYFDPTSLHAQEMGWRGLGWPWYTVIGTGLMLTFGSLLSLRHSYKPARSAKEGG